MSSLGYIYKKLSLGGCYFPGTHSSWRWARSGQEAMGLCLRGRALRDAPRVRDGGLLERLYLNSFHPSSRLFESALFRYVINKSMYKHRFIHDVRSETTWKIKSVPNLLWRSVANTNQSLSGSGLEISAKKQQHSRADFFISAVGSVCTDLLPPPLVATCRRRLCCIF